VSDIRNYQGILFDLDGTLLDTADDLGAALNHVLCLHNMPTVSDAAYRTAASDGSIALLNLGFGKSISEFSLEALREEFLRYYQENIAIHTRFYPGVKSLLKYLNKQRIPWGVVTNKPIDMTLDLLPHFDEFSSPYCLSILGGDSLPQRKPHPAPLLQASKEIKVAAEQCIYVGDAQRDIAAGNSANMFTVIAEWGYITDVKECKFWQADLSIKKPGDLLKHI
jgi:N-acetyl-D-muramate 6-phosphate phosphatase